MAKSNSTEKVMLNSEITVGPFFNWFNPKCSDLWTSSTYFSSAPVKQYIAENAYFRKNPTAYWVYGAKNYIVWSQIQDNLLRTIDTIKVFNSNEKVTTVAFAKDLQNPRVYVGSDRAGSRVYDFSQQTFTEEAVDHINDDQNLSSRKIAAADWSDRENVFYSIGGILVHWNIKTGVIEHVVVGENEHDNRIITTLCISKVEPYYMAVGYEGGQVAVLFLSNKMTTEGGILYRYLCHHSDICSLSFPYDNGNYSKGIVASVSRDGVLSVHDLFASKKIMECCPDDYRKTNPNKNRNFFAIAFVPTYSPRRRVVIKRSEDGDNDDLDETNFQLLVTTASGEMKCIYIPKNPPSCLIKRPKTVDYDRQKTYFHTNVVFNIATLCGYDAFISDPDSSWFSIGISIALDRQAVFWDFKEKRAKSAYPTLSHQIHDIAFNDCDPSSLAIASGEGLKLWKVPNHLEEKIVSDPYRLITIRKNLPTNSKLTSVAWQPFKEKQLATGTDDGQIFVLDVSHSKPSMKYSYQSKDRDKAQIYTLAWGPIPSHHLLDAEPLFGIYCVQAGGKLSVHNLKTRKVLEFMEISDSPKESERSEIAWRSDYTLLAVGNTDGSIELYEYDSQKYSTLKFVVLVQSVHSKLVQCLRWHPISIKNVRIENGEPNLTCSEARSELQYWLASGANDSKIQLINFAPCLNELNSNPCTPLPMIVVDPIRTLSGHSSRVISLAWSILKEGTLASCSYDNSVQVWDVKQGVPLHNFRGHTSKLFAVCWSKLDADLIYSGGDDNTIHVWRPSKQKYKVPPAIASGGFSSDKVSNLFNRTKQMRDFSWPVYQPDIEAKYKQIEESIANINSEVEKHASEIDTSCQTLSFGEGGDTINTSFGECGEKNVSDGVNTIDTLNMKNTTLTVPKTTALMRSTKSSSSYSKEKKKEKSFFPCTNVVENCSPKEDHYQDIEYLLSQQTNNGGARKRDFSVDVIKRTLIFSDQSSIEQLVQNESLQHRQSNCKSHEYMMLLLQGDIQKTVKEAMKKRELNETLVAMSASVSRTFWFEATQSYALQLENHGEYTLAALYLVSIYKVKEAINLLVSKKLFKEALILAKSRLYEDRTTSNSVLREWAKEKEALGNYEIAVKCMIVSGNYLEAANILAKRNNEFTPLYFAARLCKEGDHKPQFVAFFGQAFKEGCIRGLPLEQMENLLSLWEEPEVETLRSFITFLSLLNDNIINTSNKQILTEYFKWQGTVSVDGVSNITKFLGVERQNFLFSKREVNLRVAYHIFMAISNRILTGKYDGSWPYVPRVSCASHFVSAFEAIYSSSAVKDEAQNNDTANTKLLANLCCGLFPRYYKNIGFDSILESVQENLKEALGFPVESNEEALKKLSIICQHWYLSDILNSIKNVDFIGQRYQFTCFRNAEIQKPKSEDTTLVTCKEVKTLIDGLNSYEVKIDGFELLNKDAAHEVIAPFCTC